MAKQLSLLQTASLVWRHPSLRSRPPSISQRQMRKSSRLYMFSILPSLLSRPALVYVSCCLPPNMVQKTPGNTQTLDDMLNVDKRTSSKDWADCGVMKKAGYFIFPAAIPTGESFLYGRWLSHTSVFCHLSLDRRSLALCSVVWHLFVQM